MATMQEVREKFPQYEGVSDEDLLKGVHNKFYSSIPFEEFSSKIEGYAQPELSFMDKVSGKLREFQDTGADVINRGADVIASVAEPTATLATGLAAHAPAAVYSVAQGLNPLAPKGALKRGFEDTLEAFTYQPKTEAGKQGLLETGWWGEKIADVIDIARTGESTYENTGNETLAIINEAAPEIVMSILGGAGLNAAKAARSPQLPKVKVEPTGRIEPALTAKEQIKSKILNEPADASTAKFKLDAGKVVKDPLGKSAVKQGWSEPIVSMVKSVSKKERFNYKKMVSIVKKKLQTADFEGRPGDVAGDALLERVNHVKMVNKQSGGLIKRVAGDLKGKQVDVSEPIGKFNDLISDLGGIYGEKGLKFGIESQLYKQPSLQSALKAVVDKIDNIGKNPDAFRVHELKQYIDSLVSYGKAKQSGLSGKPEQMLKNLRHDLNESLKGKSKKYDKVNTAYSDTIEVLNELQSVAGKKMDLFGDRSGSSLGTLLRRLLGNTQSRVNLETSIKNIENVAIKYGGKYNDKLSTQMRFANELERMFGPMTETSFKADIVQAVGKGVESLSPRQAGVQATRTALERMSGINQENAFKAIETLLNQ